MIFTNNLDDLEDEQLAATWAFVHTALVNKRHSRKIEGQPCFIELELLLFMEKVDKEIVWRKL